MTVPKNKPGSFRFSFPETIFSPGSPEISPDFSHFFPNNSVPIPISIARLTKNRPPYQLYSQQWPVSVTDACTSRRCQTPRRNTVKGHKSHTDNFFFIFSLTSKNLCPILFFSFTKSNSERIFYDTYICLLHICRIIRHKNNGLPEKSRLFPPHSDLSEAYRRHGSCKRFRRLYELCPSAG